MTRLVVRVTPRADRDEICGWRGAELVVKVTAAPEGGKANAAVERTVAAALGLPKSAARVVRGHSARVKQLDVDASEPTVHAAFGEPEAGLF